MSWPRESGFAKVYLEGDKVIKKYILNNNVEARELAQRIWQYDKNLRDVNFPLAELHNVNINENYVIIHQEYISGDTLDQYLDESFESGSDPSEIASRGVKTFTLIRNIIEKVGIVGRSNDDLLQSHQISVGYDWQPMNFAWCDGDIVGFDLVYPLKLTDSGLPDLNHRARNFDVVNPAIGYFVWYSYVGALHTVIFSILQHAREKVSTPAFEQLRSTLQSEFRDSLVRYGYTPKLAAIIDLTTHLPIRTAHHVTGQIHTSDLVDISKQLTTFQSGGNA